MTTTTGPVDPRDLMLSAAAALDRTAARLKRAQTTSGDREAWATPAARAEYQHDTSLARGLRAAAQRLNAATPNAHLQGQTPGR